MHPFISLTIVCSLYALNVRSASLDIANGSSSMAKGDKLPVLMVLIIFAGGRNRSSLNPTIPLLNDTSIVTINDTAVNSSMGNNSSDLSPQVRRRRFLEGLLWGLHYPFSAPPGVNGLSPCGGRPMGPGGFGGGFGGGPPVVILQGSGPPPAVAAPASPSTTYHQVYVPAPPGMRPPGIRPSASINQLYYSDYDYDYPQRQRRPPPQRQPQRFRYPWEASRPNKKSDKPERRRPESDRYANNDNHNVDENYY